MKTCIRIFKFKRADQVKTLAWGEVKKHTDYNDKKDDALKMLLKALQLRETHKLPRTEYAPLECYGFAKEWMTSEETWPYPKSLAEIIIQSTLARERLYKGRLRLTTLKDIISLCMYS